MFTLLLYFLILALTVSSSHLALLRPQPFSRSLSPGIFGSAVDTVTYSASFLPRWLSLDPDETSSINDEGSLAEDSLSLTSSALTLCGTSSPELTLQFPISAQFTASNPSLSSVFVLAPNSALTTQHPALRIPPKWSFSIGFLSDTFWDQFELHYNVLQRDGSPLPSWMDFNSKITLNGVTPGKNSISEPAVISLSLLALGQSGCSAASLPFDIVVASHELSCLTNSLPTINITASTSFNFSLSSPADYSGVLVDGITIQLSQISNVLIDTSQYANWLKYDPASRTLSGDLENNVLALGKQPPMPVTLITTFNQSIQTLVSLAIVPSYFSASSLQPIQVVQGDPIHFNLIQDLSNATLPDEVNLTATCEPSEAEDWLKFDSGTGQLAGIVPTNFSPSRIIVTFTAYSHITHSTSHASLPILLSSSERTKKTFGSHPVGLSAVAHSRLVLGLSITFGIVGGLCLIGVLLAAFRHCARITDTAIGGEEGRNVWSEQDKKWYGVGLYKDREDLQKECDITATDKSKAVTESPPSSRIRDAGIYGDFGHGLRRVSERSQSEAGSPESNMQSPGFMSKREFIAKIKETVRIVSDKAYSRKVSWRRPTIGKPILLSRQSLGLPLHARTPTIVNSPSNPFDDPGLQSYPGSTIMTNSPSASTGEHSIPRRRADFAPPRSPAQVHFEEGRLTRQLSSSSTDSLASNASVKTHATEAVVQTASKATSILSSMNPNALTSQAFITESSAAAISRPRLVPFTSATRVPIPRLPASSIGSRDSIQGKSLTSRIASQTAKVLGRDPAGSHLADKMEKSESGDELRIGLHYVQSLGADKQQNMEVSVTRSSFSSLETSRHSHGNTSGGVLRTLVRSGERFRFRIPIPPSGPPTSYRTHNLKIKLISGKPLPKFLHTDMSEMKTKGTVELYGIPASDDLGEVTVGIYDESGVFIKTVIIEVVKAH